jgi:hypothetical protein
MLTQNQKDEILKYAQYLIIPDNIYRQLYDTPNSKKKIYPYISCDLFDFRLRNEKKVIDDDVILKCKLFIKTIIPELCTGIKAKITMDDFIDMIHKPLYSDLFLVEYNKLKNSSKNKKKMIKKIIHLCIAGNNFENFKNIVDLENYIYTEFDLEFAIYNHYDDDDDDDYNNRDDDSDSENDNCYHENNNDDNNKIIMEILNSKIQPNARCFNLSIPLFKQNEKDGFIIGKEVSSIKNIISLI